MIVQRFNHLSLQVLVTKLINPRRREQNIFLLKILTFEYTGTPVHATKLYVVVETQFYSFLVLALFGNK
jgi:hypothetical protein